MKTSPGQLLSWVLPGQFISRHISSLEIQLSVRLFERSRSGVSLTDAGHHFRDAVVTGLRVIHAGAAETASLSKHT